MLAVLQDCLWTQECENVRVVRERPVGLGRAHQMRNLGFRFVRCLDDVDVLERFEMCIQSLKIHGSGLSDRFDCNCCSFRHDDLSFGIFDDKLNDTFCILLFRIFFCLLVLFTMFGALGPFAILEMRLLAVKDEKHLFDAILIFQTMDHSLKPFFERGCRAIDETKFMGKEGHVDGNGRASTRQRALPHHKTTRTLLS